ncbi:MAG: hypothetical protein BTN85_2192 [Candidatus Methanohalarchaeum thermophilum]|uniref:Uncharacterized protein n=1 Tax=Methanohalarchaeum thermophilum TaxID=1903181 RepID=A0A1Q6DRU8_METT1|nr:MAG: hypothetical protein BTN85_2192 [Candidatus Methanohalarchaeum thermophilum]
MIFTEGITELVQDILNEGLSAVSIQVVLFFLAGYIYFFDIRREDDLVIDFKEFDVFIYSLIFSILLYVTVFLFLAPLIALHGLDSMMNFWIVIISFFFALKATSSSDMVDMSKFNLFKNKIIAIGFLIYLILMILLPLMYPYRFNYIFGRFFPEYFSSVVFAFLFGLISGKYILNVESYIREK